MPNDLNELSEESLENDNYIVKKEEDNAVTLDEKQLSSSSDTTSLKKADLSNLGYNAGLRGRYKKSEKAVDSDVNEKLLSAAHSLLELSGKSPKDARKQRPATKTPLNIVTSEKSNYIDEDVAVIAHQPVGEFKPMKSMVKEDKPDIPVKPRFKEIRTDSADPFDDKEEEELGSSDHAALQEKEYIPKREETEEEVSSGNYLVPILLAFLILGGIGYGVFYLTKKLTDVGDAPSVVPVESVEATPEEQKITLTPVSRDEQKAMEARLVAENYLTAQTSEQALSVVRKDGLDQDVFNKYWKPVSSYITEQLEFSKAFALSDGSSWVSFLYGEEGGQRQLNLFSKADESFQLDWKAYSEVEEISLKDFSHEQQVEERIIRAWIRPSTNYDQDFSADIWLNCAAFDITGTKLNCYMPLFSKEKTLIYSKLVNDPKNHPIGGRSGVYTILKVIKPSKYASSAEVLEVISASWTPEIEVEKD